MQTPGGIRGNGNTKIFSFLNAAYGGEVKLVWSCDRFFLTGNCQHFAFSIIECNVVGAVAWQSLLGFLVGVWRRLHKKFLDRSLSHQHIMQPPILQG